MVIQTAGVVAFREDTDVLEVLLVRHTNGAGQVEKTVGLPAGRLEPGETPREAAVRECFDETGMRVKSETMAGLGRIYSARIPRSNGSVADFAIHVYIAREYEGELTPSSETEPFWLPVAELSAQKHVLPNVEQIVKDAIAYRKLL